MVFISAADPFHFDQGPDQFREIMDPALDPYMNLN